MKRELTATVRAEPRRSGDRVHQRRATQPLALLAMLPVLGCFGTPTPLVPGLSGSVGLPHHGVQTGAIELPQRGEGFVRFRGDGGFHWGQPALVRGIMDAARKVQDAHPGGEPLVVGDLSAQFGGKIARHQSHRSGRDVDLLWYLTTQSGEPIRNSSFVPVREGGLTYLSSRGNVRLDVAREWMLIKALLTSPHLEVQWLYASSLVETLLLAYATLENEDPELIRRVRDVMLQPLESLPHDDHLHLRIACSPEASVSGCEGGGPHWSWLSAPPALEPDPDDNQLRQLLPEGDG